MQIKNFFNRILQIFFIILFNFGFLNDAQASLLVNCGESTAFRKRLDASIKKLESRLKKYEPGTLPALGLEQQIMLTRSRFERYGKSNLMCGKDGLPHLIADCEWEHTQEFVLPGILFIYIAGWIGWSGRQYIKTVATIKNPADKEIIIDVPLALQIMISAYLWPINAWKEFLNGDFVAKKSEITISPR